jgi:plastocyanin
MLSSLLAVLLTREVHIDNFQFQPQVLQVRVGTRVSWINRDDMPHSVVGPGSKFRSELLDTDGQYSYVFTRPGTYPYFCGLHPHMTGKIVVK